MLSRSETDGTTVSRYDYAFLSRHAGALWAGCYAAGVIAIVLYARFTGSSSITALVVVAVLALPLAVAGILAEFRLMRLLRPITVTVAGIETHSPEGQSLVVSWKDIERIEVFASPDLDARRVGNKAGIRIIAGDRRIRIYEHIRGYAELCVTLEAKIRG